MTHVTQNTQQRLERIVAKRRRDFNPREVMPECTAFIVGMREVFGAPVGIRATENGRVVSWGRLVEGAAVTPLPAGAFSAKVAKPENAPQRATPKSDVLPYALAR